MNVVKVPLDTYHTWQLALGKKVRYMKNIPYHMYIRILYRNKKKTCLELESAKVEAILR